MDIFILYAKIPAKSEIILNIMVQSFQSDHMGT